MRRKKRKRLPNGSPTPRRRTEQSDGSQFNVIDRSLPADHDGRLSRPRAAGGDRRVRRVFPAERHDHLFPCRGAGTGRGLYYESSFRGRGALLFKESEPLFRGVSRLFEDLPLYGGRLCRSGGDGGLSGRTHPDGKGARDGSAARRDRDPEYPQSSDADRHQGCEGLLRRERRRRDGVRAAPRAGAGRGHLRFARLRDRGVRLNVERARGAALRYPRRGDACPQLGDELPQRIRGVQGVCGDVSG